MFVGLGVHMPHVGVKGTVELVRKGGLGGGEGWLGGGEREGAIAQRGEAVKHLWYTCVQLLVYVACANGVDIFSLRVGVGE
jgi:hypothetical protein